MQIFANYLAASKWLWISIAWIGRLDVGNALCGESTGHRHQWIQCQRTSFADLSCFVIIVGVDNIMEQTIELPMILRRLEAHVTSPKWTCWNRPLLIAYQSMRGLFPMMTQWVRAYTRQPCIAFIYGHSSWKINQFMNHTLHNPLRQTWRKLPQTACNVN